MNNEANHAAPTPAPVSTAHLETKPCAQFVVLTGRGGSGLGASIARLTAGRVGAGVIGPHALDSGPGGLSACDNDEADNQSWGKPA